MLPAVGYRPSQNLAADRTLDADTLTLAGDLATPAIDPLPDVLRIDASLVLVAKELLGHPNVVEHGGHCAPPPPFGKAIWLRAVGSGTCSYSYRSTSGVAASRARCVNCW